MDPSAKATSALDPPEGGAAPGSVAPRDVKGLTTSGQPVDVERSRVRVGERSVGGGAPCFVIAEAGVNHNGDPDLARALVDAAARAGADAVKFQTFEPKALATASAPKADYQLANDGDARSQLQMLEALVLPRWLHEELADRAAALGILFLSSPFDEGSADFLEELGVPAFKVPSGEVTNHPFLAHLSRKGLPLLLSTGMCTLAEVEGAVELVRRHGDPPLALFHCVSSYPAEPKHSNLRAMETLRRAFGVPVGWSDHTLGVEVCVGAAALGAELLEKHFTLDRSLPGPDHRASLLPDELATLVRMVRAVESSLGSGEKVPAPCERSTAQVARKSLHWRVAVPVGEVVRAEHVSVLRPGTGLAPSRLGALLGRKVLRPVRPGAPVCEDELEGAP